MSYPSLSEPKSAISAAKKPQSLPWSNQETVHLIKAYQEKWHSLKRGQLNASQWKDVADAVAARCDLADDEAKSALQCRHKMEKLRRRYRSELQSIGDGSSWPYYDVMDALESGPLPAARPSENHKIPKKKRKKYEDEEYQEDLYEGEEDEEVDQEDEKGHSRSRSIGYILRKPSRSNRFSSAPAKRRREEEETGVAAEIRRFAERVMGMERRKMEMTREMELWRMEMENRRMEMILNSEKKILEAIARRE